MPASRACTRTPRRATRSEALQVRRAMPLSIVDLSVLFLLASLEYVTNRVAQGEERLHVGLVLRGIETELDTIHQAEARPELGGERRPGSRRSSTVAGRLVFRRLRRLAVQDLPDRL